jgi:hypothetical protein
MVTATAAPAAKGDAKAPPPPMRPFFTGTLDLETHTQTYTNTLSTSAIPLSTFYPKTNGFLADLWIRLAATGGATAGTLQTNNDGILGYLAAITLSDTGGQPILGPMTGHEFAMFVKWGGFSFSDDPRNSETFTEVSTVGNGTVTLHIPVQFVRAEPLGPLPNTNSNNAYALDITQAAASAVFLGEPRNTADHDHSGLPGLLPSVGRQGCTGQRRPSPPRRDSVPFCTRGAARTRPTAGSQDFQLSQQEGSYRAVHFILKDSVNSRVPRVMRTGRPLLRSTSTTTCRMTGTRTIWIRRMERDYGYTKTLTAAANPVAGRDFGVFTLPFITDGGSMQAGG